MSNPWKLYDMLIGSVHETARVSRILFGKSWVRAELEDGRLGMAAVHPGPIPQAEEYEGRTARDVIPGIKSWNWNSAAASLAVLNACVNRAERFPVKGEPDAFLRYRDRCAGKKVAVIGHFAYLENRLKDLCDLYVLERMPKEGDWPDPACEYLLPGMDVVYITGSALANKTLPRLLELSRNAFTVISGPSTPMSRVLLENGADSLCGFCVCSEPLSRGAVLENNGIFQSGQMLCLEKEGKGE